jgi:hypothetical protein
MIETVMLVPTRDNEGKLYPRSTWRELELRLLQFGGLSDTGTGRGVWVSGSRVYRDRNRQFTVSLGSWKQLPAWLDVVAWVRTTFRQEAIYVKVAGVPEVIT